MVYDCPSHMNNVTNPYGSVFPEDAYSGAEELCETWDCWRDRGWCTLEAGSK